jgi:catechol 2,3-dioxygenase-like lactoylglutathione lyase family enzyme
MAIETTIFGGRAGSDESGVPRSDFGDRRRQMTKGRKRAEKMDLNHLQLHVRNLDHAQRFYESYFGFREHMRHADILFLRNTSGFELALRPERKPSSFPEWFHFGFRLASERAVRKLHSRLSAEGVRVRDVEDYENYVTFRCKDPDGYDIEIYWC